MDADPPISLQTPQEAAHRALALGALVFRAVLDQTEQVSPRRGADPYTERAVRNLTWWLVRQNVIDHQSTEERRMFRRMLGEWPADDLAAGVWRAEALGVLLWALNRIDAIPPYDALFDLEETLALIPLFEPVAPFVEGAALRPAEAIGRAREIAELWHWRARITQMQQDGRQTAPDGTPLEELVRRAADLLREEGIAEPLGGDFPAFGQPYASLLPTQYDRVYGASRERHLALNWLCGYARDWDHTPTNT
ncbi:MAG: DUF4272 domain-containing protein [Anaerolineae bacterium]